MTTAPASRESEIDSLSRTTARNNPPSVAQEGWITLPCPSGTNMKPGIADERHHRAAQHHQRHAAAPSDAAEIAEAGAQDQRDEHDA